MSQENYEQELKDKKWFQKKENYWIGFGFSIALIALGTPFLIMNTSNQAFHLNSFEKLGVVGDFFGGTTVGLLSLASIVFVTAAIIMQKEELELQRKEVAATRKEYEITNQTMKKQQFESTFFNMINLHHSILNDIVYESQIGREAIKKIYKKLDTVFNNETYKLYIEELKKEIFYGDQDLLDELIRMEYWEHYLSDYKDEFELHFFPAFNEYNEPDTSEYDEFILNLANGTDKEWNSRKKELLKDYNENIYMNRNEYWHWLKDLNFKRNSAKYSHVYMDKFLNEFQENTLKELKLLTYEKVYKENESNIGHYFRNLYRIVKLIQETEFDSVTLSNNKKIRKNYLGILRAQLSSFELLMIFYNMVYSNKGEKFKELIKGTNFFDDHIVEKDFIWVNDSKELEALK